MAIGSTKYQYLVCFCVNIISLSYGAFCVWPSASFLILQSEESPLKTGPLTTDEAGWICAMLCVGGGLGGLMFAWCIDKFGRRISLMLIALPSLISWLIIPFAQTPFHIGLSRFIGGIAGGGTFGVIPLYITEIADNDIRGVLGSFMIAISNVGVLIAFVLGYYFSYATVAWIMLVPVVIFLFCFPLLPETPQYLMNKNKVEKAEKALCYLRNIRNAVPELPNDLKTELEKLKPEKNLKEESCFKEDKLTWRDFVQPKALKAIMIGVGLMSINQLSGTFAILSYSGTIFKISGANFSPNMSAIIVGIVQLMGSYTSIILADRCRRKVLLCSSAFGTAFGLITLGTYLYLSLLGYDLKGFSWIPVASLSFTIFAACCGILPLSFILMSEIIPPKIRNIGSMISLMSLWIFAFTMLKLMPTFIEWIGLYGTLFMCGGYCLASIVVVAIFLPETKGKSVDAILALL